MSGVASRRRLGEEPVCVEVAAAQRHCVDHSVRPGGTETQRHTRVAHRGSPVHHRPFVQAEAVEPCRPRRHRAQEIRDEPHSARARMKVVTADRDAVAVPGVPGAVEVAIRSHSAENGAVAGMPDTQLAGSQAVVGEQEVEHRVRLAGPPSLQVRPQEFVGSPAVGGGAFQPVVRHRGEPRIRHRGEPRIRHRGEPRIRHRGEPRIRHRGEPRIRHDGCRRGRSPPGPRRDLRAPPPR